MSKKEFEKLDDQVFSVVDARNARLQKSYQDIVPELRAFYLQMVEKWGVNDDLTFADLNKYNRWDQLLNKMESISGVAFKDIISDIDTDLQGIYTMSYNTAGGIIETATGSAVRGSLQASVLDKALKTPVGGLTIDLRMDRIRDDLVDKMTSTITTGIQNGDSWTKIAGEFKNQAGKNLSTVQRIVRTEGHRLEEQGKLDVALKSRKPLLKVWTTERDSRVRSWHVSMDGHDINCRCFSTYVPKEDVKK